MRVFKEFKEFALKGSVLDMAVGIILGAAFGKVVTSFVDTILSPPLGLLLGQKDLSELYFVAGDASYPTLAEAQAAEATVIAYGQFVTVLLEFFLVALALFFFIRAINRMRRKNEAEPALPTKRACPYCRSEIALDATRCPACTSEVAAA